MSQAQGWHRWLARVLILAVAGYLGVAWWVGGADTLAAIRRIGAGAIALGLAMTMASFGLRVLRWQLLLRALGARLAWGRSAAIYLAGIGLSASPGKVGETVRSAFLLPHGVPVGSSLAAFFVDRMSDLLAVLLLAGGATLMAAGAGLASPAPWFALAGAGFAASLVLRLLVRADLVARLAAHSRPNLGRLLSWLGQAGGSYARLWSPTLVPASLLLSIASYGLQGLIYAYFVSAVAPDVTAWTALAICAASTLAGAASMVPGGLGAMELSLVLLLQWQGASAPAALAAALALRGVTFWFGLLLGAFGLSLAARSTTHD